MKHGKMYLTMCLLSMVLVLAAGCGNNNAAGTNTGNTTEQNGTDTPAGNDTVNDNGMNSERSVIWYASHSCAVPNPYAKLTVQSVGAF